MMKVAASLPDQIATEVGQVIALWAQVEHKLRSILANAAGTSIKTARAIFKEPSAEAFANALRDLLMAADVVLEGDGLKVVEASLKNAKERRDILAHSVWGYDEDDTLGVQRTRGTWDLGQAMRKPPRTARKVHPDFLPIDLTYLQETRRLVGECLGHIRQLDDTIAAIRQSLLRKFLEQACPKHPQGQASDTPQSPPQSSGA